MMEMPVPTVSPIEGKPPGVPDPRSSPGVGFYTEQEFLVEGVARSFALTGERTADGRWSVKEDAEAPFVTRILVRRPIDPAAFSGTVAVEWNNVSGGVDVSPDWSLLQRELTGRGHIWVGVSRAEKAGIDGGGMVEGIHLKLLAPRPVRARSSTRATPGRSTSSARSALCSAPPLGGGRSACQGAGG